MPTFPESSDYLEGQQKSFLVFSLHAVLKVKSCLVKHLPACNFSVQLSRRRQLHKHMVSVQYKHSCHKMTMWQMSRTVSVIAAILMTRRTGLTRACSMFFAKYVPLNICIYVRTKLFVILSIHSMLA